MGKKEFPNYVHSNNYPFLKKQTWYLLITDEKKEKIVMCTKMIFRSTKAETDRVTNLDNLKDEPLNEHIFEMRQRIGRVGVFKFLATFINDSYMGFDQSVPLTFEIKPEDRAEGEIPEYFDEDIAAVKGPGVLQSMMDANGEEEAESSESDQDLDEVERLKSRLKKAGLENAMEKRRQPDGTTISHSEMS